MTPEEQITAIVGTARNPFITDEMLCNAVRYHLKQAVQPERARCAELERVLERFVLAFAIGDAHHSSANGCAWDALADARALLAANGDDDCPACSST